MIVILLLYLNLEYSLMCRCMWTLRIFHIQNEEEPVVVVEVVVVVVVVVVEVVVVVVVVVVVRILVY